MRPDILRLFQHLAFALAIGLLIGAERGWQERDEPAGGRVSGIRTYALIGLSGGLWGALYPIVGPAPLGLAYLAFAIALTAFEWRQSVAQNNFSATGLIAGLITFALGSYAVLGDMRVAGAAAVAAFALLAEREALHAFLEKISWIELRAFLVLLAMTFVLLPVLPDRAIDPYGAVNPHLIWLMAILIATISYAGYIAVRLVGARKGLLFAGAVGGIISSTSVTLSYSQLVRKQPELARQAAPGILAAWMISLLRMTLLAAAIAPALFPPLAGPVAAAMAVFGIAALLRYESAGARAGSPPMGLSNPFELGEVLRFAGLLAAIMAAAKLLTLFLGEGGLLPLAALTGLADEDPITLSVARMLGHSVDIRVATHAILIAAGSNMLSKMGVAAVVGGWRQAAPLVYAGFIGIAAAAATLFAISAYWPI